MAVSKPIPIPTEQTKPFWEATKRGVLLLQNCCDCGAYRFPPNSLCTECGSTSFDWKSVSGRGKIYSYVVFHRAYHPAFEKDLPYAVACIELNEGPRLMSRVVGISPEQIRCDMLVEVAFEKITDEISMPTFRQSNK